MGMCTLSAINDKGAEYIKRIGTMPRNLSRHGMEAYNLVLLNEGVQYVSRPVDSKREGSPITPTKVPNDL